MTASEFTTMDDAVTEAVHGIPTAYRGVLMRSRLEATWAAFFDLGAVDVEYEPFDLPGYIPDFVLPGQRLVMTRVESTLILDIKPALIAADTRDRAHWLFGFCDNPDVSRSIVCLGVSPRVIPHIACVFGITPTEVIICDRCRGPAFDATKGGSSCCGAERLTTGQARIDELWAEAKNITQWRSPRSGQ